MSVCPMSLIDHGLAAALVGRAAAGSLPGRFGWSPHQPFPKTIVFDWDLSGSCSHPVLVRRESERRTDRPVETHYRIDQVVRCRNCDACIRARQWHWMQRGVLEHERTTMMKGRSWMVTLTCGPEARKELIDECNSLDPAQLAKCLSSWVTRWLKSIRHAPRDAWRQRRASEKQAWQRAHPGQTGVRAYLKHKCGTAPGDLAFKYVLVTEQHRDGFPHVHLVMHEAPFSAPLRKAYFRKYWKHGFVRGNLVKSGGAALYVCKYLTKAAGTRVRASRNFGKLRPQGQATAGKRDYTPLPNKENEINRSPQWESIVLSNPVGFVTGNYSIPNQDFVSRLDKRQEYERVSHSIQKPVRTRLRGAIVWLSRDDWLRSDQHCSRAILSYRKRLRYWVHRSQRTNH